MSQSGRLQGAADRSPEGLEARLRAAADAAGTPLLGVLAPGPQTPRPLGWSRTDPPGAIAIFGYDGTPNLWRAFSAAPECVDGAPHPLDRWSKRVGDALAEAFGAQAAYPFGGPPYQPFFSWAQAADRVWSSPIGMLVGADRGLWVGYRAALIFADPLAPPARPSAPAPCETCAGQPCRTACPVGAFSAAGYDAAACAAHLDRPEGEDCRTLGCRARRACPVAAPPEPAQAAFHLEAFRRARRAERAGDRT